jgi:hypothetical protein
MKRRDVLVALFITRGPLRLVGAQAPASRGEAEVRAVVERYLHGLKFNDVKSLEAAFWPDARLLFIKPDGTLGQFTQGEWYRMFSSSAGKEEEGDLRIATVDVSDNAASVKLLETYPKSVYIDYLNLLRIGTEWRIVNKIYTTHRR